MESVQRNGNGHKLGFVTPLRYPGGKRKLLNFFSSLIKENDLFGVNYVEPFAGGAGLALSLLMLGYVKTIYLNDLDFAIYTFWKIVIEQPDKLCGKIEEAPVVPSFWIQQRDILKDPKQHNELDVAFATLYLNRTNRSGILRGGPIGGLQQKGKWKMDARFNKKELINRIQKISKFRDKIKVSNQEATDFLLRIAQKIPNARDRLIYADPPYFTKGKRLYFNSYSLQDHRRLAEILRKLSGPRLVSYDEAPSVYALYQGVPFLRYQLHYTAQARQRSGEVMFFWDLNIPPLSNARSWHPMLLS